MINGKIILAFIPARGGSKGLPKKNIKPLCGKPLINYSIDLALRSSLIDKVVVSTDSKEIAKVAKVAGAEAPFLRPAYLAEDLTTDPPVIKHCLLWYKEKENYAPDIIVLLRPTGPLRTLEETEEAIRLLEANPNATCVRSVEEPKKPPYKMWEPDGKYIKPFMKDFNGIKDFHTGPRQLLPKVYQSTPDIHVFRTSILLSGDSIMGDKILPFFLKRPTVDIDSEFDFEMAEYLIKKRKA